MSDGAVASDGSGKKRKRQIKVKFGKTTPGADVAMHHLYPTQAHRCPFTPHHSGFSATELCVCVVGACEGAGGLVDALHPVCMCAHAYV
jgi:hypothetical protein